MNDLLRSLLSLSLSGALLTVVTACLNRLLKGRVPRNFLYYLWLLVLLRFICPVGTEWSLTHRLVTQSWIVQVQTEQSPPVGDAFWGEQSQASDSAGTLPSGPGRSPAVSGAPTEEQRPDPIPRLSWSALLTAVWGIGALAAFGWRLAGYVRMGRRLRAGELPVRPWEEALFLQRTAGESRPPRLCRSAEANTPMLAGVFRPVIYLPLEERDRTSLGYSLDHELVHWRRRDLLYKWGLTAAVCVHWFNPAAWYLARAVERDCELSCDEAVVCSLSPAERKGYGAMLLETAACQSRMSGALAVPLWNQKNDLKERLYGIMRPTLNSRKAKCLLAAAVVIVAVSSVAFGAYAVQDGAGFQAAASGPSPMSAAQGDRILNGEEGLALDRSGDRDAVLITYDGGKSWEELTLPQAVYDQDGWLTADPETWNEAPLRVLADLPEEDITLYDVNLASNYDQPGMLLRHGSRLDLFSDLYCTPGPRMILPEMALADYDGDGAEELAVGNCTGTGTGVAAYHLYLFEETSEGGFALGAALTEDALRSQVDQNVISEYDPESFSYTIRTAGGTYLCDLSADGDWLAEAPVGKLTASEYFSYELNPLRVSILLRPAEIPMCDVVWYAADVVYDGTALTLDPDSGSLEGLPGYALTPVSEPARGQLAWPFALDGEITLSALYGGRIHPITGQANEHTGIDVPLEQGTAVLAAADGLVITAEYDTTEEGLGNYVVINHGTMTTVYGHMKELSVAEGETVAAGQQIGTVGMTGRSTGPHLHFEVRADGLRVDPLDYLPQAEVYAASGGNTERLYD